MGANGKTTKGSEMKNGIFRSLSQAMEQYTAVDHGKCAVKQKVPVSQAGLLSRASYWWMWQIMLGLYKDGIRSLMHLSWWTEDAAEHNVQLLEKAWNAELLVRGSCKASLGRAMRTAYKKHLLQAVAVILVTFTFSFLGSACVLRLFLDHISSNNPDSISVIAIVVALIACEFCRSFTFSLTTSLNYLNGMRGRAAAMGLLYKKILNLRSLQDRQIGELVNMFSHDGQRVFEAMVNGPFIIGGPLVFLAGSIYVGLLMGCWALVGIATYIVIFVIMKFLGDAMEHFRKQAVNLTGQRVGLMNEVMTCMKLIKMNGWEPAFLKRILESRQREKLALERGSFFKSVVTSLMPMIPVIASVFMFLGYILSGNDLTAARAFTVISVLYAMTFSLATSLYGVQSMIDVSVAMTRYKQILLMPEKYSYEKSTDSEMAVEVKCATLTWESRAEDDCEVIGEDSIIAGLKPEEVKTLCGSNPALNRHSYSGSHQPDVVESSSVLLPQQTPASEDLGKEAEETPLPVLQDINFRVKKGQLIGICGMKGSGKSSLLAALLGRMQILEGDIKITGSIAFVGQDPWIMNGTARENILFGRPFQKDRYDRIIKATKLDKDFETFGASDEVEIGDRGLTLSGGQKQRICLARAIYSESSILLLDDPLSTVDVNIGRHIFAQCIKTILHDKTIFIVTHHLEYLPKCDKVMYMHDGHIVSFGSHTELMNSGGPYQELFILYNNKYDRILKERMMQQDKQNDSQSLRSVSQHGFSRVSKRSLNHQLSMMSMPTQVQKQFSVISSNSICAEYENVDIEDLVVSQKSPDCHVRARTYWTYIQAMGGMVVFLFLLVSYFVSISIQSLTTGYLAYWLNQGAGQMKPNVTKNSSSSVGVEMLDSVVNNPDRNTYAAIYGLLLVAMLVILVARSFIFAKFLLRASSYLHKNLIEKTLKSPMRFFDVTPIGIIINRFTADLDEIDVRLPANCELSLQNVFLVLSALVLISVVFPWDLLAIIPLVATFGLLAHMFSPILQQLKFMDNITRAPYLSHLTACVEGIATIHSFNQGQRFYHKFCELLDRNSVPFFLFYAANRWLAVFLDCMTIVVTGATGFLIVFTLDSENSSQAGMALSFAIQITSFVQYSLRHSMESVSRFTSVQRIQDYVETLHPEGSVVKNPVIPPATWPSEGTIKFKQYKMKYNGTPQPVINGITLNIKAQEKIGIVGNSGSGKSSLGVGLFRLTEAASGSIYIDNINIRDVPLDLLRSRLSILVQDPVLFTGTIRYNLDPFGTITSDDAFWQALDKCHIKKKICSLEHGLDTMVEENGRNFSMGERQLLCLARTLLRNSKILVLDEATASVDSSTEVLVQQTINECFHNCTVLMIAHRINTVWDCDKILVMEAGKAVEFNTPTDLLQRSCSRFKSMFDMVKSAPRGASINEDPVLVDRSRSSAHAPTSCRLSSSSHIRSSQLHTPPASPVVDLSFLRDSDIFDDDDALS